MQVLFPAAVIVLVPVHWFLAGKSCILLFENFILLDQPIIARVTATAWRQLLQARNSPSPHERQTTTAGTTSPTLYEQCVDSLTSHKIYICKGCETGPTVFRSYPRRLERITVCRCLYKAALSPQLFKDPECWSGRDLNQRPPARQTGAYPTELTMRRAKAN